MLRGYFYEPSYVYFKDFPIAESEKEGIEKLIEQILSRKKQNPDADTTALEAEIDLMVYKLYGLTLEEAKIVDSGFNMSKDEYDNLEL